MQHNFSNTEWASRAHSFVRDGVWPFEYDSVEAACEAFAECVKARRVFRSLLGGGHHVQALAKLSFHINALASWMDQAVIIERRALECMGKSVKSSLAFKAARKAHYATVRYRNAERVYRRLGTPDAHALYVRWVSPFPPVVDATSYEGGRMEIPQCGFLSNASRQFELGEVTLDGEPLELKMPPTREPVMIVDVDRHSPLGVIAHACIERGDKSVNVSVAVGDHSHLAPPVVVHPYGQPLAFIRRPYDQCPTDMVIDAAGCIISRQEFERLRDKMNEEAALRRTLWSQAVMLTQGVKRVVKEFVKAVRK